MISNIIFTSNYVAQIQINDIWYSNYSLNTATFKSLSNGIITYGTCNTTWQTTTFYWNYLNYPDACNISIGFSNKTGLSNLSNIVSSLSNIGKVITLSNLSYTSNYVANISINDIWYSNYSNIIPLQPLSNGIISLLSTCNITSNSAQVYWNYLNYPGACNATITLFCNSSISTVIKVSNINNIPLSNNFQMISNIIFTSNYVAQININDIWYSNYSYISQVFKVPIYTFTSFTFTTIGATGINGPTSLSSYGTTYPGYGTPYALTLTGGIQYCIVPISGIYLIIVGGAGGGTSGSATGGRGIIVSRTLTLNQGAIISILVGQKGSNSGSLGSGGGGGGTYVVDSNNIPILIAGGGGGGGGFQSYVIGGGDGLITTNGGGVAASLGGSSGYGGAAGSSSGGGSGAGFNSATTGGGTGVTSGGNGSGGAHSFLNNGTGASTGGFGGGGCGAGGYSGGANDQGAGGGGGSYDRGNPGGSYSATQYTSSINGITGGYNSDNGFVYISLIQIT